MSSVRPRFGRFAAVAAGGLAMALFVASPAMADTSQSSASALQISSTTGPTYSTGSTTASNDGTTETNTGDANPPLSVLGGQTILTAGVLGQTSRAFADGTSGACAGVVGTGGAITVGPDGSCLVTPGAGVTFTLGLAGQATIALETDGVYANCTATSAPTATGTATLANARITSTLFGVTTTLLSLPVNPAPNTSLEIPGILLLTLNEQSTPSAGAMNVIAANLNEFGGSLPTVAIGTVGCGPNAAAPPVPSIPLKGAPIAIGLGLLIAAGGVIAYRRMRVVRTA